MNYILCYICTHIHLFIYVYSICTYTYIYIHICTYVHIHMYIHDLFKNPNLTKKCYSLRSLLYFSYSPRSTSFIQYWLIVIVFPPMASFTTTRALSGSRPSICPTVNTESEKTNRNRRRRHEEWSSFQYLSVQILMNPRLHQNKPSWAQD